MSSAMNEFFGMRPEEILHACGGFYRCPRDSAGKWLGPLVGYTSRDAQNRNRLGSEYVNFRTISDRRDALFAVAVRMSKAVKARMNPNNKISFCGIPTGGKDIVKMMDELLEDRCFSLEKREAGVSVGHGRAMTDVIFGDERPQPGESLVVVEDVGNAFSTTEATIRLLEGEGARVEAISVFLNRSEVVDDVFLYEGRHIPVIALWRQPMPIYDQDHRAVAADVARDNVSWKPKEDWPKLMKYHQPA